ncbi:hypothetical protein OROMI_001355 [Orobanche minor]
MSGDPRPGGAHSESRSSCLWSFDPGRAHLESRSLVLDPDSYPAVIRDQMFVTSPETRPSYSTANLISISLEYSSITIRANTYHLPDCSKGSTDHILPSRPLHGESVNVGAACRDSASLFFILHDGSRLIDAEVNAYMGILQFDPKFVGMRWLDDWAAQTVLVHTSFLATCINVWNNSKRRGGSLSIDDDDLDFLINHIHGLIPLWGDHLP